MGDGRAGLVGQRPRLIALVSCVLGGVLISRWLGDRLASEFTRGLSALAALTDPPVASSPPASSAQLPLLSPPDEESSSAESASGSTRAAKPGASGLYITGARVMKLAEAGYHPRGLYVDAAEARPAGLALLGVAALGIGLREGDVLTHVDGRPARSESQVIHHVVASRGARVARISGTIWRRGRGAIPIVVEQPYLIPDAATEP